MTRRHGSFGGVVLACWLVLGASGDDFHVVRIAAPFLPLEAPGDSLPLDDPNTDFTEDTDPGDGRAPRAPNCAGNVTPRTRTRVARPLVPTPSDPPLLTTLAAGMHLPLRC